MLSKSVESYTVPARRIHNSHFGCYVVQRPQVFQHNIGKFGIGPPDMREGDVVCTFYDAEVLFVLRQVEAQVSECTLTSGRSDENSSKSSAIHTYHI
jgi:hypothetical protein